MNPERETSTSLRSTDDEESKHDFAAHGCTGVTRATMAPANPDVPASLEPPDLIGVLLAEQRSLTAVEAFSAVHEAVARSDELPAQSRYYSKLLPATPPGPGQQYAFDVDLDRCSGCKACVTACHSLNGLDEHETWRDVGMLVGGDDRNPLIQHVTTACHHCVDPGCLAGCPVDAYEKDPVTGIVRHLDDQCFGCQYCTLTCPYDVPKYHPAKGIVRKCDLCSQRLADDEAPACVQACPHEAIAVQLVDVASVADEASLVPDAPNSGITRPTTTYRTQREGLLVTRPVDLETPRPQHAHLPLVVMLVLTQFAAGAFFAGMLLEAVTSSPPEVFLRWNATVAAAALQVALAASTLHLGRPLLAFRGMLGWRHSWLSREILAFGVFAGVAVPYAVSHWIDLPLVDDSTRTALGWLVVGAAFVGVYCSVMIYVFTKREFWSFGRTSTRFLLTSLVAGTAAAWAVAAACGVSNPVANGLALALCGLSLAKLAFDAAIFRHLSNPPPTATASSRSARLMAGPLVGITTARFVAGAVGGLILPFVAWSVSSGIPPFLPAVAAALVVFGEGCERYLFFAAAAPPRMPGSLTT